MCGADNTAVFTIQVQSGVVLQRATACPVLTSRIYFLQHPTSYLVRQPPIVLLRDVRD